MQTARDGMPAPRWDARLDLGFAVSGSRTALVRRAHSGPLQVQRPFYPEGRAGCHVYVLHPPGGLVGGDRLVLEVTADAGAEALLTTPAATKFYRSTGARAEQSVSITVAKGGVVEWLPQETIVFGGANGESRVRADVESGGHFFGWDVCCFGRPASGDRYATGRFVQRLELRVDGEPVCVERAEYEAGGAVMHGRTALAGFPVTGTFVALTDRVDLAERVRAELPAPRATDAFSVTARRRVLVCRYLGESAMRAREGFSRAWAVARAALLGRAPHLPRIWAT
ncbi:MAG TPA: urease accessory protein UreD [Polyangiaceae bacterium]|nr:urease accessory protein UreD [Polyangiaceae bacterium]